MRGRQLRILRRTRPAKPTNPVPSNVIVPGSGTTDLPIISAAEFGVMNSIFPFTTSMAYSAVLAGSPLADTLTLPLAAKALCKSTKPKERPLQVPEHPNAVLMAPSAPPSGKVLRDVNEVPFSCAPAKDPREAATMMMSSAAAPFEVDTVKPPLEDARRATFGVP